MKKIDSKETIRTVSEKMCIKPGMRAIFVDAPDQTIESMKLPELKIDNRLVGMFDYIHLFVITQVNLERQFPELRDHLAANGKFWVSWPKARKLGTDLTLTGSVIPTGYRNGLVESTCLSIDETWSGLRFTWPKAGKIYNNGHAKLIRVERQPG